MSVVVDPELPEVPDDPDDPELPEDPDEPDDPELPEDPDEPDDPELPEDPELLPELDEEHATMETEAINRREMERIGQTSAVPSKAWTALKTRKNEGISYFKARARNRARRRRRCRRR